MADRRNAKRGAHYKARTKEWLASLGYQVAHMEVVHYVFRTGPNGPERMPVKRDQFASDLLAMRADPPELIFVQCKGGDDVGGNFLDARRKFAEHAFPSFAKQWIVAWKTRSREPRVIDCTGVPVPPKRTRAIDPSLRALF